MSANESPVIVEKMKIPLSLPRATLRITSSGGFIRYISMLFRRMSSPRQKSKSQMDEISRRLFKTVLK